MTQRPEPYRGLRHGRDLRRAGPAGGDRRRRGTSMAGLALAWLLADERVTQVVIGPGRPEHLAPAAEALRYPVTEAERADIESAAAGLSGKVEQ